MQRFSLTPRSVFWLRVVLTLATLLFLYAYLASRPDVGPLQLHYDWKYLLAALIALPLWLGLRALKWRALLRTADATVNFRDALRSYLGGLPLGMVTPGRMGEFARGLYLPQPDLRGAKTAGLVLIDSYSDFLTVLAWALPGVWAIWGWPGLAWGLLAAAVFWPLGFWLLAGKQAVQRIPRLRGLRDLLLRFLPEVAAVRGRQYHAALGWSVVAFAVEWLQYVWVVRFMIPDAIPTWELMGVIALVTLLNSFQVTLAGLGIREGLAAFLLFRLGVSPEIAALSAFLFFLVTQAIPALLGLAMKPVASRQAAPQRKLETPLP